MATKAKISSLHGYTIRFLENETFALKVETENEILEFDGIKGNIYIASDFESLSDTEAEPMALKQYIESAREFFTDWGVDETAADAIIKEITPWFEKFAVEEPTADAWEEVLIKRVDEAETKLVYARRGISKAVDQLKRWLDETDECFIVSDIPYKAQSITDAEATYKAVWKEYTRAQSDLAQYRETMHRQ